MKQARMRNGTAALPEAEELIVRLGTMIDEIVVREADIAQQLERESKRADEATSRAERLASRLRTYAR